MALEVLATYIPETSPGGASCAVKTPGGERQSDYEGGTNGPSDDGGEGFG